MSLSYEMRVMELDSQTHLLERLQLLTQFSSNFVAVKGEAGMGKTWLSHRYLESWAHGKNQSLVTSFPNQDDQVIRGNILRQLFPLALYSETDTLHDSVERILEGEACDVVVVVDDAQHLSQALLAELWLLVLATHNVGHQTVSVVLFSASNHTYGRVARLSHGLEIKPIELEVDELSKSEAKRLFETLVLRYADESVEKRIKTAFTKARPIPGDILVLGEQTMEKKVIIRSLVGSPAKIAALVIVLIILIFLGYRSLLQPSNDQVEVIDSGDDVVITTPDSDIDASSAEQISNANQEMPAVESTIDDSMALPPQVTSETASVGESESGERVVITSDVVDALLEDNTAIAVAKAAEIQAVVLPENTVVDVESDEVLQTPITFSFARDELKAMAANTYTLQMSAMTSMDDVQRFLNEHTFDKPVRVYPTIRNDEKWYIVTYDQYSSIQAARDAAEALPEALRSLGAWAKSLSQVHREIDRGQASSSQ
ncbi:SPOR domain-containing protein [Vibrio sp. E150_011]